MSRILMIVLFMASSITFGNDKNASKETRIYQTDSIGTIQADKPHFIIQKDGRVLPTDSIGTRDSGSKDQYRIIGDRIYETDSIGTVKHDKSLKIK
jgi:hypothetical protein